MEMLAVSCHDRNGLNNLILSITFEVRPRFELQSTVIRRAT